MLSSKDTGSGGEKNTFKGPSNSNSNNKEEDAFAIEDVDVFMNSQVSLDISYDAEAWNIVYLKRSAWSSMDSVKMKTLLGEEFRVFFDINKPDIFIIIKNCSIEHESFERVVRPFHAIFEAEMVHMLGKMTK